MVIPSKKLARNLTAINQDVNPTSFYNKQRILKAMIARIYQFLILLLQFICGGLIVGFEWNFMAELVLIILPFSIVVAVLFTLYKNEIKKQ